MKTFLQKNYVLVAGIIAALVLTLQQFLGKGAIDAKALGLSALVAVIGVIANQWKGKGVTITGIIGNVAYSFVSIYNTGTFSWTEFGITAGLTILLALSEGLKSYAEPVASGAKASVN